MRRRTLRAAVPAALAGALALGGCGIRATSVPVDAGAAPTRVSCAVTDAGASPSVAPASGPRTTPAQIYLVCSERVTPVQRMLSGPLGDRVKTARMLLAELERKPDAVEERAGFASEVPGGLSVGGGQAGDPPGALRLSQSPRDLPSYALAQLVCTFAGTAAGAADQTVELGGPGSADPVRPYRCDDALRTGADAGATAGTVGLQDGP